MEANKSSVLQRRERSLWPLNEDYLLLLTAMCTLAVLVLLQKVSERENSEVPTVKFYGRLIPNIFSRLRYNSNARTVIYEGYEKVGDALGDRGEADSNLVQKRAIQATETG